MESEHLGAEYGSYDTGGGLARSVGRAARVLSLAGNWRCALDPADAGAPERWFARSLELPIDLPGTLDEAGYGEPCDERTLRCLSRRHVYVGAAWYQRTFELPADWPDGRLTLSLERVMWESRVWLDDQPLGARDSLCTPHVYDLSGRLTPGVHRLTVRVDNRARPGASCHGYGDDEQIIWNGLLGRLELTAQDAVHLRGVQVYPDAARGQALVRVEVGNLTCESVDGVVSVSARAPGGEWLPAQQAGFKAAGEPLPLQLLLPLGDAPALWDEFAPALYDCRVELTAGDCRDRVDTRFGLRDLTSRGTQLAVNGRTVLLRGTHDGGGFPLTGYPAMDVPAWRRIFRICREWGLNHVRYHSFCPPGAAFEAADEEGVYLQPELPFWGQAGRDWAGTAFLRAELRRILDAYGHHPSFCLMSMGNEHSGDWDVLAELVDEGRRHDPRHLYAAASNQYIRQGRDGQAVNPGDEFACIMKGARPESGYERGRIRLMERLMNGEPPAFDADYREILTEFDVPTIAHELGQYWVFPDLAELDKYTGVLRSGALELFRESLADAGLLERAGSFHTASGALAVELYKEDLERELRTPGLGGFQLLDLHDYTGQMSSLVGLLDAFWDSKGLVQPDEWRRYCAPTVVLARLAKRVWTSSETLAVEFELCHYGPTDLSDVITAWRLTDGARVVAEGSLAAVDVPTGRNTVLGRLEVPLATLREPVALRLEATAGGVANDWTLWVHPAAPAIQPAGVRVTDDLDADTLACIEAGGRVLYRGHTSAHCLPTKFCSPIWNPFDEGRVTSCGLLIDADHPALAGFPTASHSDWQWRDLLEPEARAFVLTALPADAPVLAEVIDQPFRALRLGLLVAARLGAGVLVATSLDLAGTQLERSLLAWLAADDCAPELTLTAEQTRRLFVGDGFALVAGPPADGIVLDVLASANLAADGCLKWSPEHDAVRVQAAGCGYEFPPRRFDPWRSVPSVSWRRGGQGAWMGRELPLRLHLPAGFRGTVWLHFRDRDSGQARAAVRCGRDACYVGPHDGDGQWVALAVERGNGPLDQVAVKPAAGDTWSGAPRIVRLVVTEDTR